MSEQISPRLQPPEAYLRLIAQALLYRYVHRQVEPPTETTAYAKDDVVFAPIEISDVVFSEGDTVLLESVKLIDGDELNKAIDLIFLKSEVSIGAVNAAASVPSGAEYLGTVKIAKTEYTDLGAFSVAEKKNVNEIFAAASDAKSLWVAGIAREAITYTSTSGLSLITTFRRS